MMLLATRPVKSFDSKHKDFEDVGGPGLPNYETISVSENKSISYVRPTILHLCKFTIDHCF